MVRLHNHRWKFSTYSELKAHEIFRCSCGREKWVQQKMEKNNVRVSFFYKPGGVLYYTKYEAI